MVKSLFKFKADSPYYMKFPDTLISRILSVSQKFAAAKIKQRHTKK